MTDPLGRTITCLRLSVTERCDLRCRYCMPGKEIHKKAHNDMLTEEEMVQAVRAAASLGVSKLRITGGEPLVKKNIISICKNCASCNCLRLPADGKIKPRLHSNDEFSIKGLSYDEMLAAFRQAIAAKPARHAVLSAQCRSEAGRNMNQIRG